MHSVEDEKDLEVMILAKKPKQSTIETYVVHMLCSVR